MTSSVDGLVSGLDTSSLISNLMKVEAQPQTDLKTKVGTEQKVVNAYQAVNTRLAAVGTAAAALTDTAAWQSVRASSSSDAVTATATSAAPVGNTTFDVTRLATAHVATLSADPSGAVAAAATAEDDRTGLYITVGTGDPVHVELGTNTLQGAADAINAKGLGIRAGVVVTDQGPVLQLVSTRTGSAAAFTVGHAAVEPKTVVPGVDAQIAIGDPGHGGYTASGSTNTFTGMLPGVTFTATRVQDDVTISVAADAGGIADKVQTMVNAVNAALTEIHNQTGYDQGSKTGSALTGNFTVRQLEQSLLSGVSDGKAGYGSFKQLGVQLDSSGKLTFDRAAFLATYQADPATTQSAVASGQGLAGRLSTVAKGATDPISGTVTLAIQGANTLMDTFKDQITDWDVRLRTRQDALQRQFAGLEVALGKLKDQSNWLAGQIAGLPKAG